MKIIVSMADVMKYFYSLILFYYVERLTDFIPLLSFST